MNTLSLMTRLFLERLDAEDMSDACLEKSDSCAKRRYEETRLSLFCRNQNVRRYVDELVIFADPEAFEYVYLRSVVPSCFE